MRCPECEYSHLFQYKNSSYECPCCHTRFMLIRLLETYYYKQQEERWYPVKEAKGEYEVSSQYRIRRCCKNGGYRNIRTYLKHNELYVSICCKKLKLRKEFNVHELLKRNSK